MLNQQSKFSSYRRKPQPITRRTAGEAVDGSGVMMAAGAELAVRAPESVLCPRQCLGVLRVREPNAPGHAPFFTSSPIHRFQRRLWPRPKILNKAWLP